MSNLNRAIPPRPDPSTGAPRPPAAPTSFPTGEATPTNRQPRSHPPIPTDRGALLEWYQGTTHTAIVFGVVMALLMGVLPTANSGSFHWMTAWWWWWLLMLGAGFIVYKAFSNIWVAAGASWAQTGKSWVDTYQLTSIKVGAAGANQMLRLKDSAGREASFKLRDVQRNQALWDLVYNGILHSVSDGQASPPMGTRKILSLPEV